MNPRPKIPGIERYQDATEYDRDLNSDLYKELLELRKEINKRPTLRLMTTTERDLLIATRGDLIYNTTTNKLNVYTTAWEAVTSA